MVVVHDVATSPAGHRGPARSVQADQRGAVLILVALGMVAMLGMAALVADIGLARVEKHKLQTALDAATLAAAQDVRSGAAVAKDVASSYTGRNLGKGSPVATVVCPSETPNPANTTCYRLDDVDLRVTTPYPLVGGAVSAADVVHADACRAVGTGFARVLGWRTMVVCSSATAAITMASEAVQAPGLLALGRPKLEVVGKKGTKHALLQQGKVTVNGGTIWVDSQHKDHSVHLKNKSVTTADALALHGESIKRDNGSVLSAPATAKKPTIGDPLDWVPEPTWAPKGQDKNFDRTNGTLTPGIYGKLTVQHGGSVKLQGPGVFVFYGIEVRDDNSLLDLSNGMIFNVNGQFKVDRGGDLEMKAMNAAQAAAIGRPEYEGIALFQARCKAKDINTPKCDLANGQKVLLKGKKKGPGSNSPAAWRIDGAIYAASSPVQLKGETEIYDAESNFDDDESNDPADTFDPDDDAELAVTGSRTMIIGALITVGKGSSIVLTPKWPDAAKPVQVYALVE
jgi:hypothetical protein